MIRRYSNIPYNLSRRAAASPRVALRGYWDRQINIGYSYIPVKVEISGARSLLLTQLELCYRNIFTFPAPFRFVLSAVTCAMSARVEYKL
jgi:hypothetical protein